MQILVSISHPPLIHFLLSLFPPEGERNTVRNTQFFSCVPITTSSLPREAGGVRSFQTSSPTAVPASESTGPPVSSLLSGSVVPGFRLYPLLFCSLPPAYETQPTSRDSTACPLSLPRPLPSGPACSRGRLQATPLRV